jgi:hypothetical protein
MPFRPTALSEMHVSPVSLILFGTHSPTRNVDR